MISVTDLEQVARARLEDSFVLAGYGRYDGSVYLCGYALEIALKVRICKLYGRSDFPEDTAEFKTHNLKNWQTHDFGKLLNIIHSKSVNLNILSLQDIIQNDPKYFIKYSFISSIWEVDYRYKKLRANDITAYDMIEANEILLGIIL
jgi:hypothetical protein